MKHKVIKRGYVTYYISDTSVVVYVGGSQYISYNIYSSPSRSNVVGFRDKIINSKEDEYGSVVNMMDLAQKCKVIGSSTRKPSWIDG